MEIKYQKPVVNFFLRDQFYPIITQYLINLSLCDNTAFPSILPVENGVYEDCIDFAPQTGIYTRLKCAETGELTYDITLLEVVQDGTIQCIEEGHVVYTLTATFEPSLPAECTVTSEIDLQGEFQGQDRCEL